MAQGRSYRLGPEVGRGGFGVVHLALVSGSAGFRKRVALKMVNKDAADKPVVIGRMRDEARMLGLVRHRAIVQVEDLIQLNGRWTLVMEWIDGVDVEGLIASGAVPLGPALEIAEEVAAALDTAWNTAGNGGTALHLMHRDIKPGNIRVTPQGEVKVLDFGTARATFDERESSTQDDLFGSLHYIAPERVQGHEGPAADVWSLGIVLLEMLRGKKLRMAPIDRDRHEKELDRALDRLQGETADLLRSMLSWEALERPTAAQVAREARTIYRRSNSLTLADWAAANAVSENVAEPQFAEDELVPDDQPPPKLRASEHAKAITKDDLLKPMSAKAQETVGFENDDDDEGQTLTYDDPALRALATARLYGGEVPLITDDNDDLSTIIRDGSEGSDDGETLLQEVAFEGETTLPPTADKATGAKPAPEQTTRVRFVRTGFISGIATIVLGLLLAAAVFGTAALVLSANPTSDSQAAPDE